MKEKFYVYIIQSQKDKTLYIGSTKYLSRRIYQHNYGLSKFTKSRCPWKLVWYCVFPDRIKAENFEKYLKSGSGRAFLKKRFLSNPS